jgi:hypothetical protein
MLAKAPWLSTFAQWRAEAEVEAEVYHFPVTVSHLMAKNGVCKGSAEWNR